MSERKDESHHLFKLSLLMNILNAKSVQCASSENKSILAKCYLSDKLEKLFLRIRKTNVSFLLLFLVRMPL